jgi:hypothetical protein
MVYVEALGPRGTATDSTYAGLTLKHLVVFSEREVVRAGQVALALLSEISRAVFDVATAVTLGNSLAVFDVMLVFAPAVALLARALQSVPPAGVLAELRYRLCLAALAAPLGHFHLL